MITEEQIKKLEANGFTVGPVEQLLSMTEAEIHILKATDKMHEILGTYARAKAWMNTKRDVFDGKSALEMCETEEGAKLVMDEIGRIEGGVY